MAHVSDGMLRRLADEPLAVPDALVGHLSGCPRCRERRQRVAEDLQLAHRLVARPQIVPDVDAAWARLAPRLGTAGAAGRGVRLAPRRHWQLMGRTVSAGATGAVAGVVVLGAAAAATLTTVFSPTHVAPLRIDHGELSAFAADLGLGGLPSAAATGATSASWKYGTISWHEPPAPLRTASLQAAESASGIAMRLPATLPAGVEGPPAFLVERSSTAVVTFDAAAGAEVGGSTLTVTAGPAVLAEYGGGAAGVPTLAVLAMERPTVTSDGATASELETFLLGQPGIPPALASEVRLLGNLETALPVPTPPGASETSATIGGAPAVVLGESGGIASAAVWEDGGGVVHTVAGLLSEGDVLGVARQLG